MDNGNTLFIINWDIDVILVSYKPPKERKNEKKNRIPYKYI